MLLGTQNITQGDTRRYKVEYDQFLIKGEDLTGVTVTVSSGATSTVGTGPNAPKTSVDEKAIYFWLTGGNLNEVFTASIQVTTNLPQTVNDTLKFTVVAP